MNLTKEIKVHKEDFKLNIKNKPQLSNSNAALENSNPLKSSSLNPHSSFWDMLNKTNTPIASHDDQVTSILARNKRIADKEAGIEQEPVQREQMPVNKQKLKQKTQPISNNWNPFD